MARRRIPGPLAASVCWFSAALATAASTSSASQAEPLAWVDLHVDLSYQVNFKGQSFERGVGQYPASSLATGGVAAVVLPLFVPKDASPDGPSVSDLERSYERVLAELTTSAQYQLPGCHRRAGRVSTFLSFEGVGQLAGQADAVALWAKRGVKLFGLVHVDDNALAASSTGVLRRHGGLTVEGRRFIAQVYDAGGVVDVSHASDETVRQVVAYAKSIGRPVVASHSNARRLCEHPRNLSDELVDAIASTGGVIGVNFHSAFLLQGGQRARVSDVVRHIKYLVRRVGVEHVAIGSDFEGGIRAPKRLSSIADMPNLTAALRTAGFSSADLQRIYAENSWRVLCNESFPTARDSVR